jgi:apolipoprotein N-acyltransferase
VALLYLVLAGLRGPNAVAAAAPWRGRLVAGLATGFGLYGPGLWWATQFHFVGWLVLVLVEALLLALAVVAVPPHRVAVALPAALVVGAAVRGAWPFGGLPLAGIDLGQVAGPLLATARVGGHLMLVGAVGVAGVGLGLLVERRWLAGGVSVAAVVLVALGGALAFDGTPQGVVASAAVQGGGPRGIRAVNADPAVAFQAQVTATADVPSGTALVLWPEDVVEVAGTLAGSPEEAVISRLARDLGVTLVAGVVEDVPGERRFRNAAVVWAPDGAVVDRYDKVHRVPFGEFVPFRSLVERVADVSEVPDDAVAGAGPGLLDTPRGRLGVLVSYEVFFAERARAAARAGGTVLLVPTNASSYTTSQVPTQEVAAAQLRAVETGRWVLQAAPTGYSAVVDPSGRVRARGPLGAPAVVAHGVPQRRGKTLATVIGDLPVVLAAAVVVVAAWFQKET